MPDQNLKSAINHFDENKTSHLNDLKELVRIPGISFTGFDSVPLSKSAAAVADLMRKNGLADVRILETGEGSPAVFGQWADAPGMPSILLYAHYDVQPPGREELWISPPFEPTERNGRLFGRGTSDDKAGVMMHIAAIGSYLNTAGRLPVNVKLLIEGEEESGSASLNKLLRQHRDLFAADMLVIADSENFDNGVPTLTASLRGLVTVNMEVRSLASSLHSGTWGGPLPDPVLAAAKMLATLVDDHGRPAIPGVMEKVRPLSSAQKAELEALPFDEDEFRKLSRLLDGVALTGGEGSVHQKLWFLPSISVSVIEASSRKQASNIINDAVYARIGIRIVPDMDPYETLDLLKKHLLKHAPWGVHVDIQAETPARWWKTDTKGRVFEAALRALEKGYGRKPVVAGAGGSIPFVQIITDALGGAPALLVGVGDPRSAAHSENESLLVPDWEKGCRSLIHLFSELSA